MASADTELSDPLLSLRSAITSNQEPLLTTSADPSSASDAELDLSKATHIHFNAPSGRQTFPLSATTRFYSPQAKQQVSFRTIYFAWVRREDNVPIYIAATTKLNDELGAAGAAGDRIQSLGFAERLDLVSWLDGSSEDSEHIKPLDAQKASDQAAGSAAVAAGIAGGIAPVTSTGTAGARGPGTIDPRLAEIYRGERKIADRNSILRGIKPTVGACTSLSTDTGTT
jgi:parafibromin